jgi:hypothetical protein
LGAAHHGGAEPELGEEVVQGGEVGVDGVGGAAEDGLHAGLVVADGEVAVVGVGERVAVQSAAGQPGLTNIRNWMVHIDHLTSATPGRPAMPMAG